MRRRQGQKGFTLVELAIVLVIIGLIVGGVLVGQDLIKAATVRATLSDLEKYNAAATTFRNKYAGLPGDLLSTNATQFGLVSTGGAGGRDGAAGKGDGNGLIEGCAAGAVTAGCETTLFWRDLSDAALIPQQLTGYASATAVAATTSTIAGVGTFFPPQKIRQGAFQYVYTNIGKNYFLLSGGTIAAAGAYTPVAGVTPGEARSMDEKLDDALPLTGVVRALDPNVNLTTPATAGVAATSCVSNIAGNPYHAVPATVDNINCIVQFRTSF